MRNIFEFAFSIILVIGLVYGCGSWHSYIDQKHSNDRANANKLYNEKLPVPYRNFPDDFCRDTMQLEIEEFKDKFYENPTEILLRSNWKSLWTTWLNKRNDHLSKCYTLLARYLCRLNSVSNPPEFEFEANSLLLDDFSWKLECEEKKLKLIKDLFSAYDINNSKWTSDGKKLIYFDDQFRKKIEVEKSRYYWLCDRIEKSMKDDLE